MAIRQPIPRPDDAEHDDDWSRYHGQAMSEAEFLALDDGYETDLEYYDGAAWEKGLVDRNHGSVTGEITGRFWMYRRSHGGEFGPERRVRLPEGYRKPDCAYWLPEVPSGNDSLPTVAVEVRSPSETMASQRRKCREYREAGVLVAWLIDPISRSVEVFEGDLEAEPLPPGASLTTALLPGFDVPIAETWAALE